MPLLRAINSSYHGVEFNKLERSIGKFAVPKLLHWQVHLVTITLTSFCECVFIHPNQCKKTLKQEFRKALEVSYPNCVWAGPGTVFLKVTFRSNVVSGQTEKSIHEIMLHNQEKCCFRKANIKTRLVDACVCVVPGTIPIWSQELQQSAHVCALDAGGSKNVHLAILPCFEHSWIRRIMQRCAGSMAAGRTCHRKLVVVDFW